MTNPHLGIPVPYVQICEDLCREYPEHTMRIAHYLTELAKLCQNRGILRNLAIELPKYGKAFDKGLSSGTIPRIEGGGFFEGKPRHRTNDAWVNQGVTPLYGLCFRWNEEQNEWVLKTSVDPTLVFYCRTLFYTYKKVLSDPLPGVSENCELAFFELDSTIGEHVVDPRKFADDKPFAYNFFSMSKAVARRVIPLVYPTWEDLPMRHGPGAVADLAVRKKDKFSFPTWSSHLQEWFPYEVFSHHRLLPIDDERPQGDHPAKVCSVPKTLDKVRVITVEPACNMFVQQALRHYMLTNATAVARKSIDVSCQDVSREAAKWASSDGHNATIDLKSASDYLSLPLVKYLFSCNPPLLSMLESCRTRAAIHPETGKSVSLKKYAGQGNATTFIVQSLVYTILCLTAMCMDKNLSPQNINTRILRRLATKVQVFGDDIILPSSNVLTFTHILDLVGLRVNWEKSHYQGFFREACGGDYYRGYDVTPFYLRDVERRKGPDGLVSWCAVANNAYDKGLLATAFGMRKDLDLPVNSPSGIGFSSRLTFRYSPKRRKWNKKLHRYEYHELVASSQSELRESELSYGRLYRYFVEAPDPLVKWEGRLTVTTVSKLKRRWVA